MFNSIKSLFFTPHAVDLAVKELEQAKISLLAHKTAEEYNRHMYLFDIERIKRLEAYIEKCEKDGMSN